jgi:hypothetical protein
MNLDTQNVGKSYGVRVTSLLFAWKPLKRRLGLRMARSLHLSYKRIGNPFVGIPTMKTMSRVLFALIAWGALGVVQAIPIQFDFVGTVDAANPVPNVFGLGTGDQIFGSAFIADANPLGEATYSPNEGLKLSFQIGTVSFDELQDFGYPDFPTLTTNDGAFAGLNFFVLDLGFLFSALDGSWSASFFDSEGGTQDLSGTFAVGTVAVPEPGTFALFAAAMLALLLVRRHRVLKRLPGLTD